MLATRIIPSLLVRVRELVKGERFNSWRSVGVAMQAALRLYFRYKLKVERVGAVELARNTSKYGLQASRLPPRPDAKGDVFAAPCAMIDDVEVKITAGAGAHGTDHYVETGIILEVIPHINSGGLVRMDVDQTIRTAEPNTVSGIDSPTFSERHVRTSLLAKDGSTAVIGGIIQQSNTIGTSGIPWLRDVPIIWLLFSSKSNKAKRTELIVAITPHVVKQTESESSREFLQKLKQLRRRVETQVY